MRQNDGGDRHGMHGLLPVLLRGCMDIRTGSGNSRVAEQVRGMDS